MVVLRHLKRLKADIALLQETHLTKANFICMRKLWVGQVLGSSAVKGKAGVFLVHKYLLCEVISVQEDSKGRTLTAQLKMSAREWVITNVYAPNSPSRHFFQTLTSNLAPHLHFPLLVAGDFNSVLEP